MDGITGPKKQSKERAGVFEVPEGFRKNYSNLQKISPLPRVSLIHLLLV
jgi:hypothetical protein